jgi:hypothetical protein
MASPPARGGHLFTNNVKKCGYLRKQKHGHRRFFVLREHGDCSPARLEYYESEKKFRGKAPIPKKALVLETCFNINKRADSKNKHMIVLYTRAESFAIAAENEEGEKVNYKAPAQKSLQEITELDKDDESLRKYKETLLGPGAAVVGKTGVSSRGPF